MSKEEKIILFQKWTEIKIQLHTKENAKRYFKEREIWWCSLGINIGFEQDGKHEFFERPVLVLKKFNHEVLWIVPLTTQNKQGKYYFTCEHEGRASVVILSQLRLISSKRLLRKIRTLSVDEFDEIKRNIKCFL